MADRPILFSAPMVRAILAGTKTQTRRAVKPQPANDPLLHHPIEPYTNGQGNWNWVLSATGHGTGDPFPCPYGMGGDRLWVRETWAPNEGAAGGYLYRADHGGAHGHHRCDLKTGVWTHSVSRWRPSIHMPRTVSRITLEVAGVRVERLEACSKPDAIAEGIEPRATGWRLYDDANGYTTDPRYSYRTLWESINGAESWDANPWVWVVEFKRAEAS